MSGGEDAARQGVSRETGGGVSRETSKAPCEENAAERWFYGIYDGSGAGPAGKIGA
jgi:hypothetical protein